MRIWVTGALVALLTWQISFAVPTSGLDLSWMGGLYMAIHDGKDFGSEVVFSYGPLGFLAWPGLWFSWLAVLAFLFSAAIYVAFAVTFTGTLKRSVGLPVAGLIAFLYLASVPDAEQLPLVLAVGLCFLALREDRPDSAVMLLAIGGGALSAMEILVKVSVGPLILLICVLGMAGARADRRQWAFFVAASLGGLIALWLAAGQSLDSLWDYAVNGFQIASGYNEAMEIEGGTIWEGVVLVTSAIGLVGASALVRFRDSRARLFAVALTALAAFSSFKYGIVRFEPSHLSLGLSAMLGIWFLLPWPRMRAGVFLTASVAISAIVLHVYPNQPRLDAVANLRNFGEAVELLAQPGRRQQIVNESRAALQATYNIDPRILDTVGAKRVSIDPWEIAVAWAYELNWSPLPVFQNYTAYTSALDRLNAEKVEDPDGPEMILRQDPGGVAPLGGTRSIEGRLPAWDPPEQNLATACNFVPTRTVGAWQTLSRVPDRCGPPSLIAKRRGQPGETVAVPQAGPGEIVVLRLEGAQIEGLERLRSLLWRPEARFAVLNDGLVTYRLIPGTSGDGLVVSRDPSLDGSGGFVQLPDIASMRIDGVDRPLQFDFYRVKVRPPPRRD